MKSNKSVAAFFIFLISICCFGHACNDNDAINKKETSTNKIELPDTSIQKLSGIINLTQYNPDSVKYKITVHNNSGNNERVSVPGPSDSYLEAVLYFKKTDFEKIQKHYGSAQASVVTYKKESFIFDWLNQAIKDEVANADSGITGYADTLFGNIMNGRVLLINNKVLLINFTQ